MGESLSEPSCALITCRAPVRIRPQAGHRDRIDRTQPLASERAGDLVEHGSPVHLVLRRLTFDDLQHGCRLLHAARDWGEEALSRAAEAVFIAINKFDFGVAFTMGEFANEMLETIAPR